MRGTPPDKLKRKLLRGCFLIAGFLLLSVAVMLLWNALLPQIVHAGIINYWQALGLMALCHILFGNFHFGNRGDDRRDNGPRQFMKEKLMSMDESDREAFKEEWRKRSGRHRHQ